MNSSKFRAVALGLLWAIVPLCTRPAIAEDVQGAGSTFVAPMIAKWAEDYTKVSGITVGYQSVGSGAGIDKIRAGEVDFGASDKPLSSAELEKDGLCQFPIVIGGVVPVVNLPGVTSQLKFSGELLAAIYLGKVTNWNASEIKALNPGVNLPDLPISVVHRSDGSGTTFNWVEFLSRSSKDWKDTVGSGLAVNWPAGAGGNGNAGVAAAVVAMPGAIGYVEYAYALQNKLAFSQVENSYGLSINPSVDSFQAAASTVRWREYKDFSVSMMEASGPEAYPITATTFILMYKSPKEPARTAASLAFFKWALVNGGQQVSDLHYVSLPPNVITLIEAYWASEIKTQPASVSN